MLGLLPDEAQMAEARTLALAAMADGTTPWHLADMYPQLSRRQWSTVCHVLHYEKHCTHEWSVIPKDRAQAAVLNESKYTIRRET